MRPNGLPRLGRAVSPRPPLPDRLVELHLGGAITRWSATLLPSPTGVRPTRIPAISERPPYPSIAIALTPDFAPGIDAGRSFRAQPGTAMTLMPAPSGILALSSTGSRVSVLPLLRSVSLYSHWSNSERSSSKELPRSAST
jgi:hypothetical protein